MRLLARQQAHARRAAERRGDKVIGKVHSLALDIAHNMGHISWRVHLQIHVIRHDKEDVGLLSLYSPSICRNRINHCEQARYGQKIGELHGEA